VKVILCENVPNLGEMGSTVKVAEGYARNYLLPRKMAVPAESNSAKQIEHEMRNIKRREDKLRTEMTAVAKKIEALTIEFTMRAGEEDKLFGSVTAAQISESLSALGYEVDRKNITIEEPIRTLGIFTVSAKLAKGVEAKIKVWVKKLEEEATE
jgi:large subunit ribosomal protein L9